ncbi:hypothetical protein V501_05073 [Pseudogymnoascus sp. VKM F-4519 (FW-2642)]|nr:hypothetical protein V501_05073 [Pseudogymnoascus sp. VKM F-4519 (FW-2642)]
MGKVRTALESERGTATGYEMLECQIGYRGADKWLDEFLHVVWLTHWMLPYPSNGALITSTKSSQSQGLRRRTMWFSTLYADAGFVEVLLHRFVPVAISRYVLYPSWPFLLVPKEQKVQEIRRLLKPHLVPRHQQGPTLLTICIGFAENAVDLGAPTIHNHTVIDGVSEFHSAIDPFTNQPRIPISHFANSSAQAPATSTASMRTTFFYFFALLGCSLAVPAELNSREPVCEKGSPLCCIPPLDSTSAGCEAPTRTPNDIDDFNDICSEQNRSPLCCGSLDGDEGSDCEDPN